MHQNLSHVVAGRQNKTCERASLPLISLPREAKTGAEKEASGEAAEAEAGDFD